jgi:hypothetical protein
VHHFCTFTQRLLTLVNAVCGFAETQKAACVNTTLYNPLYNLCFQSYSHRFAGLPPHLLQDPGGVEEGGHGQQEQEV